MRFSTLSALVAISIQALPVTHAQGPVVYPVKRAQSINAVHVPTYNEQWIYTVEIAIGNPPQKTLVQVDTGSPDLWVNANCSSAPTEFGLDDLCKKVPRYSPKTAQGPLGSRLLGYGSGDIGALVDIYEDTVEVGDAKVKSQKFGVASNSRGIPIGIMGLGPVLNASFAVNESYHLLLDSMAAQKVIASRAYSLGLGSASDDQGSLIFGGLDKGRYSGALQKLPIVKSRDGGTRDLGAELNEELGFYLVDCAVRDHKGGVTFGFGDGEITVPFREFIFTAQGLCAVGLEGVKDGQQILGDSFLRAAYGKCLDNSEKCANLLVVFD
ncbi:hypothetical protein AK830_g12237 [Neonectria ditissima]|uniref:Peptidase A1 domain-containing protein n=1 Tax=Neonectria ditissima TaxID=78410 RepID=A0A0P7B5W3_9HYPO|nr:hypothetical protein AK830_g12237 [Neonectria ditissima]